MTQELAIDGGSPAVTVSLPNVSSSAGRTFGVEEETLVLEALRSGCLSRNGGTMVKRFERDFADALGARFAVACSSGTSCVHLAIAALDLEPGDEVIVPPVTDIGSILPVLWQNAIPVFADLDPRTMVLDSQAVERCITPRTRAVIAVHLAGMPCPLRELQAICRAHNIVLIEDCSQAYWAEYHGSLVGSIGDMACFSLQQSKHMTCGEGGIMITSNEELAERALLFSDKAWPRDTASLGSCRFLFLSQNYRMSELAGAVALAQLQKVAETVERRRIRAAQLTHMLSDIEGVDVPFTPEGLVPSYWLYMLQINDSAGVSAEEFGETLTAEGVPAWVRYIIDPLYLSPIFTGPETYGQSGYPFSTFPHQRFERGLCPNAEAALSRTIAIHWNENYTADHVRQIGDAIRKVARHFITAPAHL
ncbi:MAG: DegT/DnrJ/EryC1/StrS family aminotransferase [Acidobacteriota bacterium]